MNQIKSILFGTLFLSLAIFASAEYKLVWQDEFNGNSLDLSKWQYEVDCNGGGNNELQCYTNHASNVQVRDGSLFVTARPENYNGKQYTSGRVNTKAAASWKYGKFEIRAKLPKGDYLWPALWLLPRDSFTEDGLLLEKSISWKPEVNSPERSNQLFITDPDGPTTFTPEVDQLNSEPILLKISTSTPLHGKGIKCNSHSTEESTILST